MPRRVGHVVATLMLMTVLFVTPCVASCAPPCASRDGSDDLRMALQLHHSAASTAATSADLTANMELFRCSVDCLVLHRRTINRKSGKHHTSLSSSDVLTLPQQLSYAQALAAGGVDDAAVLELTRVANRSEVRGNAKLEAAVLTLEATARTCLAGDVDRGGGGGGGGGDSNINSDSAALLAVGETSLERAQQLLDRAAAVSGEHHHHHHQARGDAQALGVDQLKEAVARRMVDLSRW